MIVAFSIEGASEIISCYDDCIDVILAARENGKTVNVRHASESEFVAYRAAQRAFENPQSAIDQARDMLDGRD